MPQARRREIRRWRERRAHRRRRVRLVGTAGVLVVALALVLSAAPGAHAPTGQVTLALTSGELVGRLADVASRSGERRPLDEPPVPPQTEGSADPIEDPAASADPAEAPAAAEPAESPLPDPALAEPRTTPHPAPSPAPQAAARPAGAAPAPTDVGAAMSAEIVGLTNTERAGAGLPALGVSACATEQAAARAALLVAEGRFEHDPLRPVLEACAAGTVGENLSSGYPSGQAAVAGWMASDGHRANILRTSFTQIGVACERGSRGWLCVQVFVG